MNKKRLIITIATLALAIAVSGCGKKEIPPQTQLPNKNDTAGQEAKLPEGHPQVPADNGAGGQAAPAKEFNEKEVVANINQTIDKSYSGDWKVSGDKLSKGDYTENGNYKIADTVAGLYPGSMVSIFVGEKRISSTVKQNGQPVLEGYPTPGEVGQVMQKGEVIKGQSSSMGSSTYQKLYIPFKSGDKTVAVLSISMP